MRLVIIGLAGFVLAAGMWWLYFAVAAHQRLTGLRSALQFGYGHYLVFAAGGAFSAGVSVLVDRATEVSELSDVVAAATLTVPVAVFVLGVWLLVMRFRLTGIVRVAVPVGAVVIAVSAFLPGSILVAAGVMVALVVAVEWSGVRGESAE